MKTIATILGLEPALKSLPRAITVQKDQYDFLQRDASYTFAQP
jgi:hypothetical protein